MSKDEYINVEDFQQPEYPITIITGARGVGKTISGFSSKIKEYAPKNEMFIYLRRYQVEIDTLGVNLDLISDLSGFDCVIDTITLSNGQKARAILADGNPVCLLLALSTVSKMKSNDYSLCKEIVYDEFIDIRGRELKNEAWLFLQFAMTVFRDFKSMKIVFLANATDLYNAYFLQYEVMPKSKITKFRDKGIKIVAYETSKELDDDRMQTPLAKLVQLVEGQNGSSLGNHFTNGYDDFITHLSGKAVCKAMLTLDGTTYGFWLDDYNPIISTKYNPTVKNNYALVSMDIRDNRPLIPYDNFLYLREFYEAARMHYTDVKTRTKMITYFKNGRYGGNF